MKHDNHRLNFTIPKEENEHLALVQSNYELEANEQLHHLNTELNKLVGVKEAKKFFFEIYALVEMRKKRQKASLPFEEQMLHMIFTGNPGTGKTTIARLAGDFFKQIGLLDKGHLIEVDRGDLVGEYIGHTAQRTKEIVKKALGGILFIDEAYSLSRGGEKDFGKEAIDTLVKAMEDYRHEFVLILAGYSHEMSSFLNANSGLYSRLPLQMFFPDFSITELLTIAKNLLAEKEYVISPAATQFLKQHLLSHKHKTLGNARYIRNLIERAIRQQAVRLLKQKEIPREELITLRRSDFQLH
jgi:stage V sporulation protein K